jgi:hypothetical protein
MQMRKGRDAEKTVAKALFRGRYFPCGGAVDVVVRNGR